MRTRSIVPFLIAAAMLLCMAAPATAQEKVTGDIAGSYSLLYDKDLSDAGLGAWMPVGWVVAGAVHLTSVVSVVGEVGGNYKTITIEGIDVSTNVYSFMGGVRFGSRANPKMVPFGQVLIGGARAGGSTEAFGTNVGASTTGFAIQPGAGVDVFVAPNIAVRIQGDYRLVRSGGANSSEFRIAGGVAYYIGGK